MIKIAGKDAALVAQIARVGWWASFVAAAAMFNYYSWLWESGADTAHLLDWAAILTCAGLLLKRLDHWCRVKSGENQRSQTYPWLDEN